MRLININPPVYLYTAIILMFLLHFFVPLLDFIRYPYTLTGIIPLAIGSIINLMADSSFKKQDTTVKPVLETRILITTGIFKLTRNPMYSGFVLILLGIAILLGTILPFMIVIGFIIFLDIVFIQFEEKKLESKFSVGWLDYKKNVRRWI
jgi:protein-S-isoprenylcysteine O-methyltransferase Ste14